MERRFRVVAAVVIGAVLAVTALLGAGRLLADTLASSVVPEYVNYQGYLTDSGGNPISSSVTLQFSIWDASSGGNQVWSETHNNVPVSDGYFSVLLGSQGSPVSADVFNSTARYLEVTYGSTTFPRQRFASVPYALVADTASKAITSTYATTATYVLNPPSSGSGVDWAYVVVVAKSGGDYTTINDAINSITPSSAERYLILVMPGVYEEQVTLPEYVHLKGAGVENTLISSQANTANFNEDAATTMIVPANTQVSDLRVRNNSTTNDGVALKVTTGNANTILDNVQIVTNGAGGDQHIGLYLNSGNPKLSHVYVEVSGGTSNNWGIFNSASSPTIHDSTVAATGNGTAGLRMNGGNPYISDSTISGTNGTNGQGINTAGAGVHTVTIDRSSIKGDVGGSGSSIISTDNYDFYVGASQLAGDVDVFNPAQITCAQSYDDTYNDLNVVCQ